MNASIRTPFVFLIVLGMASIAGCADSGGSGDAGGDPSEPIKIGIAAPLTGGAAIFGEEVQRGSKLAADEINDDGGILGGRTIELIFEDDEGTPEGGVAAVQKLLQEGISAFSGGVNSSVVLAETSITNGRILHVNMGAQADDIVESGGPWIFQVNNTVSQNSSAQNKYITETLRPASVVYMGENTAYNDGVFQNLQTDLQEAGIPIVKTAKYEADTRDFTPILNNLKAANAELLYVSDAFPARTAALFKQLREVGGFESVMMSPGVITQGTLEAAGNDLDGVLTGEVYVPEIDTPENKAFVQAFEEAYDRQPGKVEVVSYEAIHIIAEAMETAGSTSDYDAIAEVMEEGQFSTPRGTLSFNEEHKPTVDNFFIQEVRDGKLVPLEEVKLDE